MSSRSWISWENLKLLIVAIIVLSVLPGVIEIIRHKRAAAKQAK